MSVNFLSKKMTDHKLLSLKKDLIELQQWQTKLEENHNELEYLSIIQKQILKTTDIAYAIQNVRRENTLTLAYLCKYEQSIKNELEYGSGFYDFTAAREHETKRFGFINCEKKFFELKINIYKKLSEYSIR